MVLCDIYIKKCINDGILALGCGISIPKNILKIVLSTFGTCHCCITLDIDNNFKNNIIDNGKQKF